MKVSFKEKIKNIDYKRHTIHLLYVTLGVFLMDIGFYFFFKPSGVVGGGIGGIAIICDPFLSKIGISSGIFLYILEAICLVLAISFVGIEFFLKTVYASILSPTFIFLFEILNIPPDFFAANLENKFLICSILGALFQGVGVGIALLNNASTGGIDVIQKILNKYLRIPYSVTMYTTDLIIVFLSGFNFFTGKFSLEYVFFGLVTVFTCAFLVDLITLNAFGKKTAYILTTKEEDVIKFIKEKFNKNSTSLNASVDNDKYVLVICVLKKLDAYKLRDEVTLIDPNSFTYFAPTNYVIGNIKHGNLCSKIITEDKQEEVSSRD